MDILTPMQQLIDTYNINLLQLIFIGFTTLMVFLGALMNVVENSLPCAVRQSFRYGKHSLKGVSDPLMNRLEVPKGWFKHFYVFAIMWSLLALFLIMKGFALQAEAPEWVMAFLDFMAGGRENRKVEIDSTHALVTIILLNMQCARRFYETNFVQIFSKKSRINVSHYLVGYIHYFGVMTAVLANAEGFVRGVPPSQFALSKISMLQYLCVCIFHFSWLQQYNSNMILVGLRTNKTTGQQVTEAHLLPTGGFFKLISSPHMFFEIIMYVVVLGIIPNSTIWRWITVWVVSNQVSVALLTHQWYRDNFKNYPKQRRAILPFLL